MYIITRRKEQQEEEEEKEEEEEEAEERRTEEMMKTPQPPPYTQSPSPRRTGGEEGGLKRRRQKRKGRRRRRRRRRRDSHHPSLSPYTQSPSHSHQRKTDTGICSMNSGQLGSSPRIFLPYGRMTAVLEQRAAVSIPVIDRQEEGDQAERKGRSDSGQAHFRVVGEAREAIF